MVACPPPAGDPGSPPSRSWRCRSWPSGTRRQLPGWATGDEVYGNNSALRNWCQTHRVGYVLNVPFSFMLTLGCGRRLRADQATALVPTEAGTTSARSGSKGERDYAWAWVGTASDQHHLLVRRSLSNPAEVAYFSRYRPPGRPATLPVLVRTAGMRWQVEEDFRTDRDHFGLNHSQVRLYTALLRHLTLSKAALAICSVTAAATQQATSTLPPLRLILTSRPRPTRARPR